MQHVIDGFVFFITFSQVNCSFEQYPSVDLEVRTMLAQPWGEGRVGFVFEFHIIRTKPNDSVNYSTILSLHYIHQSKLFKFRFSHKQPLASRCIAWGYSFGLT